MKFYSFYQTIDTEWHSWSEDEYRETIREQMISSESMTIDFEWGGVTDEKIRSPIRDWATRSLEDAVERNMIEAIAPVPDDQRDKPDGIEEVTRRYHEHADLQRQPPLSRIANGRLEHRAPEYCRTSPS